MQYRYKIIKSYQSEQFGGSDFNCSLSLSDEMVNIFFLPNTGRVTKIELPISLNEELFETHKDYETRTFIMHSISLILKEIDNKFDRTEFIFNFLRDYCHSNLFNVGDSQFLRIGNHSRWALIVREPWSENELISVEEAMTRKMSFVRNKYGKNKLLYYNKEVGYIRQPDGWDFVESGNAAITRHLKKLGPVWNIVEFARVYKHHSYCSNGPIHILPQNVGYLAPRENVVAARDYFDKNRIRLTKERLIRRIDDKIKMPYNMRMRFHKEKMELNDRQKELLKDIINENKSKF